MDDIRTLTGLGSLHDKFLRFCPLVLVLVLLGKLGSDLQTPTLFIILITLSRLWGATWPPDIMP
jgi:hypothetical protein